MRGPFPLNRNALSHKTFDQNGVYLLADKTAASHKVKYVGRGKLRSRIGRGLGGYTHFYFQVANLDTTAFRRECEEFHRYGKRPCLDNEIHPARPFPKQKYKSCTLTGCKGEAD